MKRQGFGLMAAAAILAGCSSDAAWEAGAGSPSPVPNSPASGLVHPQSYRVIAEQGIVLDQIGRAHV